MGKPVDLARKRLSLHHLLVDGEVKMSLLVDRLEHGIIPPGRLSRLHFWRQILPVSGRGTDTSFTSRLLW